ncbi:MAG: reverse transcriptase/maturase family protein [Treponema sp.]|nr:reverse transcriptase/maturase family protein [Treponema sp.]
MARTYNNLWDAIIDFEHLYNSYRSAKRGKRYRHESLNFAEDLEVNLITLQNELIWNMYNPLPLRQFYVFEPKKRLISAPAFRDRVVHHSLVKVIEPLFQKKFIKETFACIVGRGTHAAVHHVESCARKAKRLWGKYYVLKCDIRKFFPSINHDIMKKIIRKTICDYRMLYLIDTVIDSNEMAGRGIPIGSLTSQLFANIYLNSLDHFIKEQRGIKYYARYMDDFIIIHNDKAFLHNLKAEIEDYVRRELDLIMNPKTGIFAERQGIDFCGYRIWPTHVLPRKSTMKRTKRRLRKFAAVYKDNPHILKHVTDSIQSFLGYVKHCSGWRSAKSMLDSIIFSGVKAKADRETTEKWYTPNFRRKALLTK